MNYNKLFYWISKKMVSLDRLASVTIIYLIFIMAPARKHTVEAAAKFSNSSKSRFNNFLKNHSDFAIHALHELSKKQARQFAATLTGLANNALPWNIEACIRKMLKDLITAKALLSAISGPTLYC